MTNPLTGKDARLREKAFEMWALQGLGLTEIGRRLQKGRALIRKWKKADNWEPKLIELQEETRKILTPDEIEKYIPDMKNYLIILNNFLAESGKFSTGKESIYTNASEAVTALKFISTEYQRLNVWTPEIIRYQVESKTSLDVKQEYTLTGENLSKAYAICKAIERTETTISESNSGE